MKEVYFSSERGDVAISLFHRELRLMKQSRVRWGLFICTIYAMLIMLE